MTEVIKWLPNDDDDDEVDDKPHESHGRNNERMEESVWLPVN